MAPPATCSLSYIMTLTHEHISWAPPVWQAQREVLQMPSPRSIPLTAGFPAPGTKHFSRVNRMEVQAAERGSVQECSLPLPLQVMPVQPRLQGRWLEMALPVFMVDLSPRAWALPVGPLDSGLAAVKTPSTIIPLRGTRGEAREAPEPLTQEGASLGHRTPLSVHPRSPPQCLSPLP